MRVVGERQEAVPSVERGRSIVQGVDHHRE